MPYIICRLTKKAIVSVTDGVKLIFFSGDGATGQKQRESRADMVATMAVHPFNLHTVIDVLLAVFLEKKDTAESAFSFLKSGKYPYLSLKEVEVIFNHYNLLGKKTKTEYIRRGDFKCKRSRPKTAGKQDSAV